MCKEPLLVKHKNLIYFLAQSSPKLRKKVLQSLKTEEINCIAEILSNFLKSHLTNNTSIIGKLSKYRDDIRIVARKKTPLYKKKSILLSKRGGNFLSILLPLATSLIGGLLK